ncbi:high mobility group nucleosome-binding domain-containing protein 3-like, partial [Octodon degus]|uniref:High mobility group nucleosome-binding domain-containing protein 3-like n=1 Tax=Octodon degus TaxID=10160 RepID=A0A6P6F1I9_OCTDE
MDYSERSMDLYIWCLSRIPGIRHRKPLSHCQEAQSAEAHLRWPTRSSTKPAPPKSESKPRKTSTKKEPGPRNNAGAKGRKEEKQEPGVEGATLFENGDTEAQKAQ